MDKHDRLKKTYIVLALIGAALWSATLYLRGTPCRDYPVLKHLLGVAPNFCVVWIGTGTVAALHPFVFKKEFNPSHIVWLLASFLAILLLSETVHALFLHARFDIWDILASVAACAAVWAIQRIHRR